MDKELDSKNIYRILGDNVEEVKPIEGKGKVNRVYLVTQAAKKVIVRLNESGEIKRFRKEEWCIQKATKLGIPSPEVLSMGQNKEISYMVLSYIEGVNGSEIQENKKEIWKTIGAYAKKINSIKINGFGERMILPGGFDFTWERHIQYNIDSLNPNDQLLSLNVINSDESYLLKNLFTKLSKKRFVIGLVHGDLSLSNVIVGNDGIFLIDWGTATSHIVPHMELALFMQNNLKIDDPYFIDFLEGYGFSMEGLEEMKSDIDALTLLNAVDKLRWSIDKKPDKLDEFSKRLHRLIDKNLGLTIK